MHTQNNYLGRCILQPMIQLEIPTEQSYYCFLVSSHRGASLRAEIARFIYGAGSSPIRNSPFQPLYCLPSLVRMMVMTGALSLESPQRKRALQLLWMLQGTNKWYSRIILTGDATGSRNSGHFFDLDHCEDITIPVDFLKNLVFIYLFFEKLARHLACNVIWVSHSL